MNVHLRKLSIKQSYTIVKVTSLKHLTHGTNGTCITKCIKCMNHYTFTQQTC